MGGTSFTHVGINVSDGRPIVLITNTATRGGDGTTSTPGSTGRGLGKLQPALSVAGHANHTGGCPGGHLFMTELGWCVRCEPELISFWPGDLDILVGCR